MPCKINCCQEYKKIMVKFLTVQVHCLHVVLSLFSPSYITVYYSTLFFSYVATYIDKINTNNHFSKIDISLCEVAIPSYVATKIDSTII